MFLKERSIFRRSYDPTFIGPDFMIESCPTSHKLGSKLPAPNIILTPSRQLVSPSFSDNHS